ncbi:MAG: hypothetical protein NT061_02745 [Spirochaetes bacterium]|nr:hypothetical protein [Spirochaetota bacterium]
MATYLERQGARETLRSRTRAFRYTAILALLLAAAPSAFGDFLFFKFRSPMADVAKAAGSRLDDEERAIAEIVLAFFYVKYGYAKNGEPLKDAYKKLSDAEYAYATGQAAKICKSDTAKGFYHMGKGGEKLLKAIIQTAEDAAKAAGTFIDKKSEQYDKK